MSVFLSVIVPGPPVPCARPRVVRQGKGGRSHTFTDARTEAYEEQVGWAARRAVGRARWRPGVGPYVVELDVYRAKRQGDADNFAKSILDGLTKGGVWRDDRYVDDLHVRLFVDRERPRAEVVICLRADATA